MQLNANRPVATGVGGGMGGGVVCVSQHALKRGAVYPGGCLPRGKGCLSGGSAQCILGYTPPPEQNDRRL